MKRIAFVIVVVVLIVGCASGPDYWQQRDAAIRYSPNLTIEQKRFLLQSLAQEKRNYELAKWNMLLNISNQAAQNANAARSRREHYRQQQQLYNLQSQVNQLNTTR